MLNNGAAVTNINGNIGSQSGASSNVVFVSGIGSRWDNSGAVNIGPSGTGNKLVVSNGAVVAAWAASLAI